MRRNRSMAASLIVIAAVLLPIAAVRDRGAALAPATAVAQSGDLNVPKAQCGPHDRVETGLQGQTTLAERFSGASMQAYNCNMELIGHFEGEGTSWQMAWFKDCAYYDTANHPLQQRLGTVVLDVSRPQRPRATAYLTDPGMLDPWEGLKVNEKRKLLAGIKNAEPDFSIYDISNCRRPKHLADLVMPGTMGHAGDFTPDGKTYYASQSFRGRNGIMPIIDVSDPRNPRHLLNWQFPGDGRPHDPTFNESGTRLYSGQPGQFGNTGSSFGPNGLVILDVSDVQYRRPNPQIRVVSTLFWEDGGQAQHALPVRIKGKPYLIFTDELGPNGVAREAACARNLPPWGFTRIIDISDERNPKTVSKLMLEVHDPANCSKVLPDSVGAGIFVYDSHYCGVDNPKNAKLLGCSYFGAGLRIFDIRDPRNPREIAYYKAPAHRTAFKPGSQLGKPGGFGGADRTTDWASSRIRFVRHRGETHVWFTSQDSGFMVLRLKKASRAL